MKYILVTGGVISGIGKGVIASSLAALLQSCGQRVTAIKIDPYLNVDAGTFSPYEHGEVFVLDDGGEVDLGLGNYERFLDVTLHSENNITTGKVYLHVITKERKGDYLGKTVQVVPHVTDAIQEFVEAVAKKPVTLAGGEPEICIIELGGTIGDIEGMPFVEAFRQFQFRVKLENFCCVHVSLVPEPKATGEQKTKPTQSSVRELRGLGLSPDVIVCRSENELGECVKEKISNFCQVAKEHVICIHDCATNYHVPLMLEEQNIIELLAEKLKLDIPMPIPDGALQCWKDLTEKHDNLVHEVSIALVGKYTQLEDAYASVIKALNHASLQCGYRLNLRYIEASNLEPCAKDENAVKYHEAWQLLCSSKGLIVPGGFGCRGIDGKVSAVQWARENKMPFLGVCLGLQCAVVEFARNVLKWTEANSQEWDNETRTPVVIKMPVRTASKMNSMMRLGKQQTKFRSDRSVLKQLYGGVDYVEERHRHGFEVNPKMVEDFEAAGMKFVGRDSDNIRMEMMELDDHPYFVAVQYHPEYISRPYKPSPPYLGLILAACGKLNSYLAKDCQMTFENLSDDEEYLENDLTVIQAPPSQLPVAGKK